MGNPAMGGSSEVAKVAEESIKSAFEKLERAL